MDERERIERAVITALAFGGDGDALAAGQSRRIAARIANALVAAPRDTWAATFDAPPAPAWSSEWPTEPGFYWFYGELTPSAPKRMTVMAVRPAEGEGLPLPVYGVDVFGFDKRFWQFEGMSGLWLPATLPPTP